MYTAELAVAVSAVVLTILFLWCRRRRNTLSQVHAQGWGRKWPRQTGFITRSEVGDIASSDELFPAADIEDRLDTLSQVHAQGWGRKWPRQTGFITRSEVGDIASSDELFPAADIEDRLDYDYLLDLTSVIAALGAPLRIEAFLVIRQSFLLWIELFETLGSRLIVLTGHPGIDDIP
ncbi:hypothetical protein C8R47DRAFT_439225 [Mycena vitilis]|nr:hypothetical protein C8R47DRAFT_439225 [Mycena vitilis]